MSDRILPFIKASACGNDFLLVSASDWRPSDGTLAEISRRMCNRHDGVGADGVEWLYPDPNDDIRARLINADGSEAEVSGNGTRCVAAYLAERTSLHEVKILTGAGTKVCHLLERRKHRFRFRMRMGSASVEGERSIRIGRKKIKGTVITTGNPHFAVVVKRFPENWQEDAAMIARDKEFPQGTNVELVQVIDRNTVEFRIYERGAGETQSSGTGSCASAIAAIQAGLVESPVEVRAPGGIQTVRWTGGDSLELEGDASLLCRGEFFV